MNLTLPPHAQVAIIMGSDSDWAIMRQAADLLTSLEIPFYQQVLSAHRTPEDLGSFAKACESSPIKVIIAGAGGAAHLPGMMAAFTIIPVIGVPIKTTALAGLDSLYSIVQMPKGIPVATVAIDQAFNGAMLAAQILATDDSSLRQKLRDYREEMKRTSRLKTKNLV